MFTTDNSEGFTAANLKTLNAALAQLVARGWNEYDAEDALTNAWVADEAANTVERLVATVAA